MLTLSLLGFLFGSSGRYLLVGLSFLILPLLIRLFSQWMRKKSVSKAANLVVSVLLTVVLVFTCIPVGSYFLIRYTRSNDHNVVDTYEWRGHTFQIYDDPLPLSIEDLMEAEDVRWSKEARIHETFLVKKAEYRQDPVISDAGTAPDLKYSVIDFKAPWFYRFCKNAMVRNTRDLPELRNSYAPVDGAAWESDEVYQEYFSTGFLHDYIVCWEKRILNIRFYWEPTPEQIAIVVAALKN